MQISPSGNFLYVSGPRQPTGVVAVFSVNAGFLTFVNFTPTADNDPSGLAIDPTGSYLYTANAAASSISIYCLRSRSMHAPPNTPTPTRVTTIGSAISAG